MIKLLISINYQWYQVIGLTLIISYYAEERVDISTIELDEEDFKMINCAVKGQGSPHSDDDDEEAEVYEEDVFISPSSPDEENQFPEKQEKDFIFPSPPHEANDDMPATNEVPNKPTTDNQMINIEVQLASTSDTAQPSTLVHHDEVNKKASTSNDAGCFAPPSPPDEDNSTDVTSKVEEKVVEKISLVKVNGSEVSKPSSVERGKN